MAERREKPAPAPALAGIFAGGVAAYLFYLHFYGWLTYGFDHVFYGLMALVAPWLLAGIVLRRVRAFALPGAMAAAVVYASALALDLMIGMANAS